MIIKRDQVEIQDYLKDASNTQGFCDAVLYPENTADVVSFMKEAYANNTNVTVCGNRTGLSGGSVPNGGFVLSTERMNKILEINTEEKFATVEPGVLLSDFLKEISAYGLYYPPDPTELNCFIGGTVATNASGSKTFKHGSTRDFVLELDLVLPNGEILKLIRGKNFATRNTLTLTTEINSKITVDLPSLKQLTTKNTAGYFCRENMDAIDLFIGSEGTLGIITRIKLKLLTRPEKILSAVIFFQSEDDGLKFIEETRKESYINRQNNSQDSIDALSLEYFDHNALNFLRKEFPNIPEDTRSAIWFEQETTEQSVQQITDLWFKSIERNHGDVENSWIAIDEKDKLRFREFRHLISAKVNEFIAQKNLRKLGTDFAVPDTELIDLYFQLKKDMIKSGFNYVIYGHLGNSHIHLNILPKNTEDFEQANKLYHELCLSAIKRGGTFSAEHGVGKNKKHLLYEMYGEESIKKMFRIKQKLDPNLILGNGNIFNP